MQYYWKIRYLQNVWLVFSKVLVLLRALNNYIIVTNCELFKKISNTGQCLINSYKKDLISYIKILHIAFKHTNF